MREIDTNQMSLINGGGFWDGFCAAATIAGIFGVPPAQVVAVGCLLYEISTW